MTRSADFYQRLYARLHHKACRAYARTTRYGAPCESAFTARLSILLRRTNDRLRRADSRERASAALRAVESAMESAA